MLRPELVRNNGKSRKQTALLVRHEGSNNAVGAYKCARCGARKQPLRMPRAPLGDYRSGAPMDRVAIDILGPLPLSKQGNRYVLVVMDCFSGWTEAYPIPDFSAKTVADVLVNHFLSRFGYSLELHSDQGRNYES